MKQTKEEKRKRYHLMWWGPLTDSQQALNLKQDFAGFLAGLSLFQLLIGLAIYIYVAVSGNRDLLEMVATLLVSSIFYAILSSLLYKFNSRILALLVLLFTIFNAKSALFAGAGGSAFVIYVALVWLAARSLYALYELHKKWPTETKSQSKYPRLFFILYGLIGLVVISNIGLIVLGLFLQ